MLRALGRGSSTVAPLRVELRPTPWLREAATSCGGRRRLLRLLRPCTIAESRVSSDLSVADNAGAPRWAVPTPGSRLSCAPLVTVCARDNGLQLTRRPGSRRASRACLGHGAGSSTLFIGCAATRSLRGSPYPSRLVALGRDSPAVAPLRVELRPPPWLREAATSCGGRRRLLRLLRPWGRYGCISVAHTGTNSIFLRSTS